MDIIETMTPQEAAERLRATGMHIGVETLRQGLQQGAFPFGTYIQSVTGGPVYFVYARLLEEWIDARKKERVEADPRDSQNLAEAVYEGIRKFSARNPNVWK